MFNLKQEMPQLELKSLDEIAVDLRSKGEMDEEAFKIFEARNQNAKVFLLLLGLSIIFVCLKDLGWWGLALIIFLTFLVYNSYYKDFLPSKERYLLLINLFAYGKIADGIITSYKRVGYIYGSDGFIIDVSYIANDGKQYKNKNPISGPEKYNLDNKLDNGPHMRVIYLENSPEECFIYTEKLNNIYNIRKK